MLETGAILSRARQSTHWTLVSIDTLASVVRRPRYARIHGMHCREAPQTFSGPGTHPGSPAVFLCAIRPAAIPSSTTKSGSERASARLPPWLTHHNGAGRKRPDARPRALSVPAATRFVALASLGRATTCGECLTHIRESTDRTRVLTRSSRLTQACRGRSTCKGKIALCAAAQRRCGLFDRSQGVDCVSARVMHRLRKTTSRLWNH